MPHGLRGRAQFQAPAAARRHGLWQRAHAGTNYRSRGYGRGAAQRFVAGMDIPSQWWTLFQSPKLNQLVEQALKANPEVGAAQAALRQAHELYSAQWTSLLPDRPGKFHRRTPRIPPPIR